MSASKRCEGERPLGGRSMAGHTRGMRLRGEKNPIPILSDGSNG